MGLSRRDLWNHWPIWTAVVSLRVTTSIDRSPPHPVSTTALLAHRQQHGLPLTLFTERRYHSRQSGVTAVVAAGSLEDWYAPALSKTSPALPKTSSLQHGPRLEAIGTAHRRVRLHLSRMAWFCRGAGFMWPCVARISLQMAAQNCWL